MHDRARDRAGGGTASRKLAVVLTVTVTYMFAEIVGGLLSGSLALLADAGHMLTDNVALAVALFAARIARRPPDLARTYGYRRVEILAALFNGVALLVASGAIAREAWGRFHDPPEVDAPLMAVIAAGGLVVNLIGARVLHGGHDHDLNVRGAYLHVLGDLLGSIGALAAAGAIAGFGWTWADPAAGAILAGILVVSAVRLVLDSIHVLMEAAPRHLDTQAIGEALRDVDGVGAVHDLHLWSLAGDRPVLTAHLVTDHSRAPAAILREAADLLRERFGIGHTTLQVEPPDFDIVESIDRPGERAHGQRAATPRSVPSERDPSVPSTPPETRETR